MRRPRALFLDLDNTLVDRQAALRSYLRDWLELHVPGADPQALIDEAAHVDDWGYTEREDFHRWWCARVAAHGLRVSPQEFWEDFRAHLADHVRPIPGLSEVLEDLARRHELVLVSNGGGPNQRAKLAAARLTERFDPERVLISGELGAWKPSPAIFEQALARVGLPPQECVMIGDDLMRDIAGAQPLGLRTCWVHHGRTLPAGAPARPELAVAHALDLAQAEWLR